MQVQCVIEALHNKGSWTLLDMAARVVVAEKLPKGGLFTFDLNLEPPFILLQVSFHKSCAAS